MLDAISEKTFSVLVIECRPFILSYILRPFKNFSFETGSFSNSLKLLRLGSNLRSFCPSLPRCWGYRCEPLCPFLNCFFLSSAASSSASASPHPEHSPTAPSHGGPHHYVLFFATGKSLATSSGCLLQNNLGDLGLDVLSSKRPFISPQDSSLMMLILEIPHHFSTHSLLTTLYLTPSLCVST